MKKKILILSALLVAGAALRAQNLNPVVEVTNAYAREATGIEKPSQLMDLPDSIYKFNLSFDYRVTNPTYKGAYEFHPYLVQMKPGARLSPEHPNLTNCFCSGSFFCFWEAKAEKI